MVGIQAIAKYIPKESLENIGKTHRFGIDKDFLEKKIGMMRLARKAKGEETSDMGVSAIQSLMGSEAFDLREIQCLVVCTQNPDGFGIPNTAAIIHGKLGLSSSCAVFDISLGCSGYVYGLSIVKAFMESNQLSNGILVTCDPYSKIIDETDKNTSLLFGDAATATLLVNEYPHFHIGHFCFGTNGSQAEAIKVNESSRLLEMNGRAVFNFAATVIPKSVYKVLELNDCKITEIDRFLFHQGSRFIVESIAKRMKLDVNRVPFGACDYGNTVSSSIPIMLANSLRSDHRILLSGFGVGLSWASTILKRD